MVLSSAGLALKLMATISSAVYLSVLTTILGRMVIEQKRSAWVDAPLVEWPPPEPMPTVLAKMELAGFAPNLNATFEVQVKLDNG